MRDPNVIVSGSRNGRARMFSRPNVSPMWRALDAPVRTVAAFDRQAFDSARGMHPLGNGARKRAIRSID